MHGRQVEICEDGKVLRVMSSPKQVSEVYGIKIKTVYNALERGGRILGRYKLRYTKTELEKRLQGGLKPGRLKAR